MLGQVTLCQPASRHLQVRLSYEPHFSRLASVKQVICRQQAPVEKTLVEYYYNDHGELIQVIDADKQVTRRYHYDAVHHLMTAHTSASGLTAHYRYQRFAAADGEDAHWRVTEHTLQDGDVVLESLQLRYDLALRQVEVSHADKGSSYHRWDKNYLIRDFVDELDNVWQFEWSDADKLTGVTDPTGNRWTFDYDLYGNLENSTDPEGRKTHTKWDEDFTHPLIRVMPDGGIWRYYYSEKGDLVALVDPDGKETRFACDNAGNRIYQRDARGNETHYRYNLRGQLESQTDCSGHVTRFFYDDFGLPTSVHNALQESWRIELSPGGRLLARTFPDGSSRRYDYNAAGLLRLVTENGELQAEYRYNVRGQVTEQRGQGKTLRLEYDNYGRLSALFNEKGEPYRFRYNALDALTEELRLDGTSRRLRYNATGDLIQETLQGNRGGKIDTLLQRDKTGRLVVKEGDDYRTEYEYKDRKLILRHIHQYDYRRALADNQPPDWQTLSFTFDALGQLTEEQNHQGCYGYEYDEIGNLLQTTYPDGSQLRHFYYGSGHLLQSTFSHRGQSHLLAEYTRDSLHREISRTQGALTESTGYDALGRVISRISRAVHNGNPLRPKIARQYRYSPQRQLQSMTLTLGGGAGFTDFGASITTDYHYDAAGRVIARVTGALQDAFSYDAADNLQDVSAAWNNQPEQAGFYRYIYDEFGRIAQRHHLRDGSGQHYHYDSASRVVLVEFTRSRHYRQARYEYDALGRRTAKTLSFVRAGEPDIRTDFHWQGMRLSGEQTTGRALSCHFYHGDSYTPLGRFDCGEGDGDLLFTHAESNGMPLLLSDLRGEVVWQQTEAGLFGRIKRESSQLSPWVAKQNLRFAGQYHDEETGLHYNTLRYYDPESGRFTQPDPIGLAGGINLYSYAPNPLTWIDPLGLSCGSSKGFNRRDRITSRWTDRLTGKKPADVHDYLTSKGWRRTYPQGNRPDAIQHIAYVKTTKSGTTCKLDYHPGGSSSQPNIHGNDYWKIYKSTGKGPDEVLGRIGHGDFKNYDLINDSPVYIDAVLMNGG